MAMPYMYYVTLKQIFSRCRDILPYFEKLLSVCCRIETNIKKNRVMLNRMKETWH